MEKDILTNKEKKVLKNIDKYLKNISMHFKNLKEHFKKYQYGIDYLFKEGNEEKNTLNNNINAFEEARKLLNKCRSNLLLMETNEIRKKLHKKEAVYNLLKEQEGSLTNSENRVLKKIDRYLKNFKENLEKLQKYHYNIIYGLYYLFNELDEVDYYQPTEIKSAFDGSYVLYESKEIKIITFQ